MAWLWWIGLPVLLVLALPFALGPFLVHWSLWLARRPRVEPVSPDAMPAGAAPYVTDRAERLRELGFELLGYAAVHDLTADTTSHLALLAHRDSGDRAMASHTGHAGARPRQAQFVEFCAELAGGREVNTNDSPEVGVSPPDPRKRTFAFPGVEDVARLYRLHRKLVREVSPAGPSSPPASGDWLEDLAGHFERDNARDAQWSGYWHLDPGAARYRPTWKGAILMTWKLAWPVGALRRARRYRRAADLLRRLEAGG